MQRGAAVVGPWAAVSVCWAGAIFFSRDNLGKETMIAVYIIIGLAVIAGVLMIGSRVMPGITAGFVQGVYKSIQEIRRK